MELLGLVDQGQGGARVLREEGNLRRRPESLRPAPRASCHRSSAIPWRA